MSDSDFIINGLRICPGSNTDQHVWNFSDAKEFYDSLASNEQILREEGRYYVLGTVKI